jgi:hypothetical protein
MKVEWVHPSWRDLVIDCVADDTQARQHFLRRSGTHGIVLALSTGGGGSGQRRLPLVRSDQDWDALTDRLFEMMTGLELPDLIAVFAAMSEAIDALGGTTAFDEACATARTVLARTGATWNLTHKPIPLDALYGWLALGRRLEPRPEPPDLSATWVDLLPARAPNVGDRLGVERFVEWLALCVALWSYDETLRNRVGFGVEQKYVMVAFLTRVEQAHVAREPEIAEPVPRALDSVAVLAPELAGYAQHIRNRLRHETAITVPADLAPEPTYYRGETFDVRRVMLDL